MKKVKRAKKTVSFSIDTEVHDSIELDDEIKLTDLQPKLRL